MNNKYVVTALAIGIQIIMIGFIAYVFHFFLGIAFGSLSGIVIWSAILIKTPVFDWFVINVEQNWAIVLGNQLIRNEVSSASNNPNTPDPRTQMLPQKSLRVVWPGINLKLPWEIQFDSVDLRSEAVIGNTLKCYTEDNIELLVTWQVILTPLRDEHLANLVRKGQDAAKAFFTGTFEQEITRWVKTKKEAAVFAALNDLKSHFSQIFGGPNVVSKIEENYGLFTNEPQIVSLNRGENYQKAAQATAVGAIILDLIQKLRQASPQADANMILAAAAATTGIPIDGLLLIPGINNAAGPIIAAAGQVGVQVNANKKGKKP